MNTMSRPSTFTVKCPDCGGQIHIDAATGKVLAHRSATTKDTAKADFDSLLTGLDASKSRAEDIFNQELSALDDRDRVMEEKFKRALEQAEQEDESEAPAKPWDFD